MEDIEFTYLKQGPARWTFEMPLLRKWIEEHSHGKVLNLFAGRVRLNVDEYRVDMSPAYKPDLNMEGITLVVISLRSMFLLQEKELIRLLF